MLILTFKGTLEHDASKWLGQGLDEVLELMGHEYSRVSNKKFWATKLVSI